MKYILFIFSLISIVRSTIYFRLSNDIQNFMNVNDKLISTLGYYQATLIQNRCSLQISNFTNGAYNVIGNYTSPLFTTDFSCNKLFINTTQTSVSLYADGTKQLLRLNGNCTGNGFFNIDDTGIMHLICSDSAIPSNSLESVIKNFYSPQTFLRASANFTAELDTSLDTIINSGNWTLNVSLGTIIIANNNNSTGQNFAYTFMTFIVTPSNIKDVSGYPLSWTSLSGINFQPRCGYISNKDFKGPFLAVFDSYWPLLQIMDQSGYKILQILYPNNDCFNYVGLINGRQINCNNWVCPPELFEFQGKCITICPINYFHSIKLNQSRCLLNCQQGAFRDNTTLICSCYDYKNPNCPSGSISYANGCNCSISSTFYDHLGSCVSDCASGYLAHQGICLTCPLRCQTCIINNASVKATFLACITCNIGYILDSNGTCISQCNLLFGQSIIANGSCAYCKDANCINCSENVLICVTCNEMYVVNNGSCTLNCTNGTSPTFQTYGRGYCILKSDNSCITFQFGTNENISFIQCLSCKSGTYIYMDKCVSNCTQINSSLINDPNGISCKCSNNLIMIKGICYSNSDCPFKMYLNTTLGTCLSCVFGCLSCISTGACTSCAYGYILYPYHPQYSNSTCIANSPFVYCQGEYFQDLNFRCIPTLSNSLVTMAINLCYSGIKGCLICEFSSQTTCVACNTDTLLFNNSCVSQCPTGTFSYQQVCLKNNDKDTNCAIHGISKVVNWGLMSNQAINYSTAYFHYTQASIFNVPIGMIFQNQFLNNASDTSLKLIYIVQGTYFCKSCLPGYGTNQLGYCISCPSPCQNCIYANNYSCTSCLDGYMIGSGRKCIISNEGPTNNTICSQNQFRNSLNLCINYCNLFFVNNSNTNCTQSCPQGTSPIKSQDSKYLHCVNSNNNIPTALSLSVAAYRLLNGSIILIIVPSTPFFNPYSLVTLLNISNITNVKNTSRLLQTSNTNSSKIQQYIQMVVNNNKSLIILNFSNSLLYTLSINGAYLPNSIYGVQLGTSRPDLIKKDLAGIGATISIAFLILLVIYTGNDILYKIDNCMVLIQTTHYFLFTKFILKLDICQFYYGFIFSHLGFIPNMFMNSLPNDYLEDSPLSFKLVNMDANIIRNAGYSLTIFIFFLIFYIILFLFMYLSKIICKKTSTFSITHIKNIFIVFWELLLMNLTFFSVTQLKYASVATSNNSPYLSMCQGLAVVIIVTITIYSCLRVYFNKIAGLYCFKRFFIAIILASYINNSSIGVIYFIEIIFTGIRLVIQMPVAKSEIAFFCGEEILIIIAYSILFFSSNSSASMIILSMIFGCFFLVLAYDLTKVYTQSRNEWEQQNLDEPKQQQIAGTQRLQN